MHKPMKHNRLHSRRPSRWRTSGTAVLAVLLSLALAAPTFALCQCCEDVGTATPQAEIVSVSKTDLPTCHAPEPVESKQSDCHSEEQPVERESSTTISMDCDFACSESISSLTLTSDATPQITVTNNAKPKQPTMSPAYVIPRLGKGMSRTILKSPEISAIHTAHYSKSLPLLT